MTTPNRNQRILVVAPTGADAYNLVSVLGRAGHIAAACPNLAVAVPEIAQGCGAILMTEEALNSHHHADLANALRHQPAWSDIPLILIVSGGHTHVAVEQAAQLLGARSNITQVERPLHTSTLLSTVQAALRARQRQYEISALLREREELLASLEKRVAERTARLEALNRELEAFSYTVSHDLRGPLRALETYSKILCEDFADSLPPDAVRYAERIARNAENMDRLTRDILMLSRLTAADLPQGTVDLDVLVADVIEQYPDLANSAAAIEISHPLGQVIGHVPSLTQCFSNLLQNALKFVPAGRTPHVRVYGEKNAGHVRVFVHDNGTGIDPAYHERIFGIFERASPTDIPGTGIGLAIVRKAVQRMGGKTGVESSLGAGARFWIELPQSPTPNGAMHPAARSQTSSRHGA